MSRLTTSSIVIDAPLDAVYRVIVDVGRYPDWISQLKSAEVLAKDAEGDENASEADRKRYDRFRDRIMFPIRSVQGDVIGFFTSEDEALDWLGAY